MTSNERHEARYQRRKEKRLRKRKEFLEQYSNPEDVFGTAPLVKSGLKAKHGVNWKPSVQRYNADLLINSRKSSKSIFDRSWKSNGFYEFDIVERGKLRHIKSVDIEERCIQLSLSMNYITPILSHYLIYDNGATLKFKGTDFALNRFTHHIRKFYQKYGRCGYIFFFDFSQYFKNINIVKLRKMTDKYLPNNLSKMMYHKFIDVFTDIGLGLGSPVSQTSAVFYANPLDHFIKDQLGIEFYGHYMDDGYIILDDLKKLKRIISLFYQKCKELGITINKKKCQIVSLCKQFRFLKVRFFVTETGKIVRRLNRQSPKKERHRLKKYRDLLLEDKMTEKDIFDRFNSWLYSQKRGKNFHVILNMIRYYNTLFDRYTPNKPKKKSSMKSYHTIDYAVKIA